MSEYKITYDGKTAIIKSKKELLQLAAYAVDRSSGVSIAKLR